MRVMGHNIYATQQEGGIRNDGRVGISWPKGDLTYTDLTVVVNQLQSIQRTMGGLPDGAERCANLHLDMGEV